MEVSTLTILYIIFAFIVLIALLCLLRIHFEIECNDEISAKLRILCIKIPLYPKNKKAVVVKKFKKGYPKEKQKDTPVKSPKKSEKKKDNIALDEKISTVLTLVRILFSRFFKHLRLDVSRILITVGGKDAAAAAITYGIVSQSVAYLLEFLDKRIKISKRRKGEIKVLCDFTSETVEYDISISASLSIWQILDIGITLAYNYFKGKDIFHLLDSK